MQLENEFREIKKNKPFYKIGYNAYMVFQDKTSVNFNSCNCYLIKNNNKAVIIDPGCSRDNLIQTLKEIRVEIKDIKSIILTHSHSDHYVLVNYLKEKAQSEVYIHHSDSEFLEDVSKNINSLFDMSFFKSRIKFKDFYRILEYFSNREKNEDSRDLDLNPTIKSVFDNWNIYSIKSDHEFNDNDSLPGDLKVIHIPGHTPGHCALFYPNHSIIFSADVDFNRRTPVVSGNYANINDYKKSINKLIRIVRNHKIKYLFPGHWNPVFSDLEASLKSFCDGFEIKQEKILAVLAQKEKMTLDEITSETLKEFLSNFIDLIDDNTKDSVLVAEASELMTNRNYLKELKRLKRVKIFKNQEHWELA
ncbi:MAG: MBL fold metallo-hydrolase [Candidatus Freyarchaeum deiterrae]